MIAIRYAVSAPEKAEERETHLEAHISYLRNAPIKILLSGPFLIAAAQPHGALVIADVDSVEDLKRFSAGDPFVQSGVYAVADCFVWEPSFGSLHDLVRARSTELNGCVHQLHQDSISHKTE